MTDKRLIPEFIFESSWEVCNKMGGIYTVLSTHAKSLHEMMSDHLTCGQESPIRSLRKMPPSSLPGVRLQKPRGFA